MMRLNTWTNIISGALIVVMTILATAILFYQAHRIGELDRQLTNAQFDLRRAEFRAEQYQQASQHLMQQLQAHQQRAQAQRAEVEKALAAHPQWRNQALPEALKKALQP